MPDTKSGRERKGRNKRRQLTERLYRRELDALERTEEPDRFADSTSPSADDLLADEPSEEPTD